MNRILLHASCLAMVGLTAPIAALPQELCCSVASMDARRQTVTAIDWASSGFFRFTVTDPALFESILVGDRFDAPLAEMQKGMAFDADFGDVAGRKEPCCNLATEIGGAGQALGVHAHDAEGVAVILMEVKRTAGNTVTVRWQYLNGSDRPLTFEAKGCVGMGCTYSLANEVHLLDGATRTKHEVLRDEAGTLVAQQYEQSQLAVGPHQLLATWAKFEAPPPSSTTVTVVIPGVSEPFEDVAITP